MIRKMVSKEDRKNLKQMQGYSNGDALSGSTVRGPERGVFQQLNAPLSCQRPVATIQGVIVVGLVVVSQPWDLLYVVVAVTWPMLKMKMV